MKQFLKTNWMILSGGVIVLLFIIGILYYNHQPEDTVSTGNISLELNDIINEYKQTSSELKTMMTSYKEESDPELKQKYIAKIGLKYNDLSQLSNEYNSKSETKITTPTLDDFSSMTLDQLLELSF